jgi:hypothetical protein
MERRRKRNGREQMRRRQASSPPGGLRNSNDQRGEKHAANGQYDRITAALASLGVIVGLAVAATQDRPASTIALGAGAWH